MKHTLTALLLLGSCMTLPMLPASAQETSATAAKKQVKKPVKKASKKTTPADKHIAIRWKKRPSRLTWVDTTTGANRFENRSQGLVWIGIPAKSMLLDAKKGHQHANVCKNAEQLKPLQASAQSTQENAAAQTAATSPDIKAAKK